MTNIGVERCTSFISSQCDPDGEAGGEIGVRRAVTISRQAGCGALAIAEKLAGYLQARSPQDPVPWTVFDRNLMDKVLEEHGLPAHLAKFLPEDRVSEIEDLVADILGAHPPTWKVVEHSVETILKLAALGNVILVGRAGNLITARLPRMFHVRLVAPLAQRIAHTHEAYGMTEPEARAFCPREDLGRERYVKKYFNADIADPLLYHMIINTGQISYDDAAQIIGDAVLRLS
jgi:Cytidylate kinase-like family